jgi:signal transduction histidine kinase
MALLEVVASRIEVGLKQIRLTEQQQRQYKALEWQNEELKQARVLSEEASRSRSEFLAMVSHELR